MKKLFYLFTLLIAASIMSSSYNTGEGGSEDGVRWATRNVDTPGNFVQNPSDTGGFFTWHEAQDACPDGWRLPTLEELQSLIYAPGSEWAVRNGVSGRTFGIARSQIFLPAAGFQRTNGNMRGVGSTGIYWSSTSLGGRAWAMQFNSTSMFRYNYRKAFALNVRCVRDI